MATAASLAGIEQFGLAWQAKVSLGVPSDIPRLLAECETVYDRILFVHNTVTRIIFLLNRHKSVLPKDSVESLDVITEQLTDSFVYDDIAAVANWDYSDLDDINEHLEDELLGQLSDLYDWADYFRVVFTK